VAAFTGGGTDPSARFRVRQHIPSLLQHGVFVSEMTSHVGKFPPETKCLRPFWAVARLTDQVPNIFKSHCFDLVLLQREILSTHATLEFLTKAPRILDVDDAIFLRRDGRSAKRLAQICDGVICGNSYLADWFCRWNKNVVVIPTAVDSDRYIPRSEVDKIDDRMVIGWIGTSGNLKYVYAIEAALVRVFEVYPRAKLRIVCDKKPEFRHINESNLEFLSWSEELEVKSIQGMDIGIMPLSDTEWSRGKCSYKMLQYMSCGIPVVVSPVGMNADVLLMGEVGTSATSMDEWVDGIIVLIENHSLRKKIGTIGRHVITKFFSVQITAPKIANHLVDFCR
jgi:glycosyltransferase involved in cell wall biosynthesis